MDERRGSWMRIIRDMRLETKWRVQEIVSRNLRCRILGLLMSFLSFQLNVQQNALVLSRVNFSSLPFGLKRGFSAFLGLQNHGFWHEY
jgi:hypothetical protein